MNKALKRFFLLEKIVCLNSVSVLARHSFYFNMFQRFFHHQNHFRSSTWSGGIFGHLIWEGYMGSEKMMWCSCCSFVHTLYIVVMNEGLGHIPMPKNFRKYGKVVGWCNKAAFYTRPINYRYCS